MKLEVYDIEVLKCMFYYLGQDIATGDCYEFEVSKFNNEIDGLVKHLRDSKRDGWVGFNNLNYDGQVLQYILDNHHRWVNLTNLQIVDAIKKFSNRVIDDTNYGLFPPYREEDIEFRQVDLFKIHHFDNENRRTSLKWLQFSMDFHNVEEMPIHHNKESLDREEIALIKDYCKNDVESTIEFLKYTLGEVDHPVYQGQNKIQDRLDLIEELGFPGKAVNWSDVKIGDEINRKVYTEITGSNNTKIGELRRNRTSTAGFTYGKCIPDYVQFKTKEFREFHEKMAKIRVNLMDKDPYPFIYNGTKYIIAKGGIHTNERNRIIVPRETEICMDADVGSQYPHSIIKRGLFPNHLGKAWLVGYTRTRDKRLHYKSRISESKKFKGLSEQYKLALNGGGFGKTNEKTNWQYDPFVQFSCTIGNQFEILMLIEELEINSIHVISANTDGIVCLFDRKLLDTYHRICKEWEKKVGNSEQGKLEFTEYRKLIQSSVNDYLAIKEDGKIKKKGDFSTEYELNKNKSRRIIALALEQYFVNGIPVEETIIKHDNIFDFCIGVKASKEYHYETKTRDGEIEVYNRMIRYYVSKNGKKLYKIKNQDSEADGAEVSQCEAGKWKCTIVNKINKTNKIEHYGINFEYYIEKANERIREIERGGRGGYKPPPPEQTSLF